MTYPPHQNIDFTGIANTFIASRNAAEQRNAMAVERERQSRLEDLALKRQDKLDQINTQRFEWERDDRLRNQASEDRRNELALKTAETNLSGATNDEAQKRAIRTANLQKAISAAQASGNQGMIDQLNDLALRGTESGQFDRFETVGPESAPGAAQRIGNQADALRLATEGPAKEDKVSELGRKLEEAGYVRGTSQFQKRLDGLLDKAGGTTINMPGALEGGTRAKLQQSLEKDEILLAELDDLAALGDPSKFLGLKNKAKNFTLGAIAGIAPEALDAETNEQLGNARLFREGVERIYLQGKVDITGASGAEKELREIRGAMLNTDLSGPDFAASFNRLRHVTERNMQIRRRLLEDGVDLGTRAGRKMLSDELDRARASETKPKTPPPPPGATAEAIAARGRAMGLTDEEIRAAQEAAQQGAR